MAKLYVGNLSYKATEDDVRDLIAGFGYPVKQVQIITDRDTGKSKGFGFVTLEDGIDIDEALARMSDVTQHGRKLTINLARPQTADRGGDRRKR